MTKEKWYDTTSEHLEYYKEQIQRWLHFWGVNDYRIYFDHKVLKDALAGYSMDCAGKSVSIALSKKWSVFPNDKLLSKCAFHEITEIMLETVSRWMYGPSKELAEATHTIVRIMENVVFEKEWRESLSVRSNKRKGKG